MKDTKSKAVECSRCGAEVGKPCKTAGGSTRRSRPHQERKLAWEIQLVQRAKTEGLA